MAIEVIRVLGIFDRQDVSFDFSKTPFFIVGPNGTGKTTALKVLHSILTGSWARLMSLPFAAVEVELTHHTLSLERADFRKVKRIKDLMARSLKRPRPRSPLIIPTDWATARNVLLGKHPSSARPARATPTSLDSLSEVYEAAAWLLNAVEAESSGKVLYFPTYRRVERDLRELLEDDEDPFSDEPSIAPQVVDRFQSAGEVVGFGGQDIRALLEETADRIDGQARAALNQHSVRFLEAISKEQTQESRQARDVVKSKDRTDRLLARVAGFSASSTDVKAISASIDELRTKLSKPTPGRLTKQQEMQLFYLGELIKLFVTIDELASPLKRFSDLINDYLRPLKRSYLRESDNRVVILDRNESEIEPDQLSSGEKQVLAFFAFLLLKDGNFAKFIIIDEPELSLSVSWQKSLIRDIQRSSQGAYICCATHSPFIFDGFPLESVSTLGDL